MRECVTAGTPLNDPITVDATQFRPTPTWSFLGSCACAEFSVSLFDKLAQLPLPSLTTACPRFVSSSLVDGPSRFLRRPLRPAKSRTSLSPTLLPPRLPQRSRQTGSFSMMSIDLRTRRVLPSVPLDRPLSIRSRVSALVPLRHSMVLA